MNKHLTAAALVLLASAGAAMAQPLTTEDLKQLDADGDGAVSRTELEGFMSSAFQTIDGDGDGAISASEAAPVMPGEAFTAADADGNGSLSADEFQARARADFAAADRDGDGS